MVPTEEWEALNSEAGRLHIGRRPTVLLADDHAGILKAAEELLATDFDVLSKVEDGRAALEQTLLLNPEVAILDIAMPILNGIEVARELRRRSFRGKVILLTLLKDPEYIEMAQEIGANGYVLKSRMYQDLGRVLKQVLEGESSFPDSRRRAS